MATPTNQAQLEEVVAQIVEEYADKYDGESVATTKAWFAGVLEGAQLVFATWYPEAAESA